VLPALLPALLDVLALLPSLQALLARRAAMLALQRLLPTD
jgi:hypothetical protein